MKSFLVVYDHARSECVSVEEFQDAELALRKRLEIELGLLDQAIEVVVLVGESSQNIRRTHSRYFRSLAELIQSADEIQ